MRVGTPPAHGVGHRWQKTVTPSAVSSAYTSRVHSALRAIAAGFRAWRSGRRSLALPPPARGRCPSFLLPPLHSDAGAGRKASTRRPAIVVAACPRISHVGSASIADPHPDADLPQLLLRAQFGVHECEIGPSSARRQSIKDRRCRPLLRRHRRLWGSRPSRPRARPP